MALAASLSRAENLCDDPTLKRIHRLIQRAGLATELPPGIKIEQLVEKMEMDKKSMVGKIKFVLCAGLGKTRFQWLSAAEIVSKLNLARNGMD
jgi:3-dehydroquinate synthase